MDQSQKLRDMLKLEISVPLEEESRTVWLIPGTNKKHRIHGPAVTYIRRDENRIFAEEWWIDGKRHREGAPAVITANGTKEYYQRGKLHRMDGPAKISGNINSVVHYIRGKSIRSDEFPEHVRRYERFVAYLKSLGFKNNPTLK